MSLNPHVKALLLVSWTKICGAARNPFALLYWPNRFDETHPVSLTPSLFTCVLIFPMNFYHSSGQKRQRKSNSTEKSDFLPLKPRAEFLKFLFKGKKFSQISAWTFFLLYCYLNTYKYNMKYKLLCLCFLYENQNKFTN